MRRRLVSDEGARIMANWLDTIYTWLSRLWDYLTYAYDYITSGIRYIGSTLSAMSGAFAGIVGFALALSIALCVVLFVIHR